MSLTHEERKARRHELIHNVEQAIKDRLPHLLRPQDDDDKVASDALIKALEVGRRDGFSSAQVVAIAELALDWCEARKNTPDPK